MTTERNILPLHERQAAASAIRELVGRHGSQAAAGAALSVSQNAIHKAVLYAMVGPGVMRVLLEHLGLDVPGLLDRYGDPTTRPVGPPAAAPPAAISPKEEAIRAAVRYGDGVREKDARKLADRLESCLAGNATTLVWVELLLGEVRKNLIWTHESKAPRARKAEQRVRRAAPAAGRVFKSPGRTRPAGTAGNSDRR
jgi:hypothetical protein